MPYISMECGTLTDEQKSRLIKELTETAAGIKELPDRNFGIGGRSIDRIKAEYAVKGTGKPE